MSAVAEILRSSQEMLFWSFLKHAPVGLAFCNRAGAILCANSAFEELLDLSPNDLPFSILDRMGPQAVGQGRHLLSELFDGSRETFQVVGSASHADHKSLRWTIWAIHEPDHPTESAVVMVEDLSHIDFAHQRLEEAERLETLGRMAGGVAHDFNNLLTGVLLYCDLLLSVVNPGDRARKYAEEIRTAALHATGLVRQLLSVVRCNKSLPRSISLNEVAEGMRNLLGRLIGDRIELKLRLDPALPLVKMDPVRAQQILLNLVLNSRDAMPNGGVISVETGNCQMQILSGAADKSESTCLPCALFAVEDNGLGMDDSVRAHLFDPFFTTKTGKGTGIGLATVHDVVTSNGGLIHVQSEPGHGTRISILLPTVPDSAPHAFEDTNFHPTPNAEVLSFHSEETTP